MFSRLLLLAAGLLTVQFVTSEDDCNYDYSYGDCAQPVVNTCLQPLFQDGNVVGSDGTPKDSFAAGDRARLVCADGYVVSGQADAVCQDDFTWSWSVEPMCVVKPPNCTTKITLEEGMYFIRAETIRNTNPTVFSKIFVGCYDDSRDYYLHGSGEYVCRGTQWEGGSYCLKKRVCPMLRVPRNGFVTIGSLTSRRVGNEVHFGCRTGYILHGQRRWRCLSTLYWSGSANYVYCEKDLGLLGVAKVIKESVDRFSAQTSSSPSRGRLSAAHPKGIDLFFIVDRSDSISSEDFKLAIEFIRKLVGFFGISSKGGATRLAVVSFGTTAKVELSFDQIQKMEECIIKAKQDGHNIHDYYAPWASKCTNVTPDPLGSMVRNPCVQQLPSALPAGINGAEIRKTLEALVKDKIKIIQSHGGGTNLQQALEKIRRMKVRCGAEKAAFLLSDGRDNMVSDNELDAMISGVKRIGKKDGQSLELFAVGIGQDLRLDQLRKVASEPKARHVFRLRDYQHLKKLTRLIIVTENDYTACGVSMAQRKGSVKLNSSLVQEAKKESWPWLVKITINQGGFRCGGALVAKNYVLTAASCLYDENGILLLPNQRSNPVDVVLGYYSDNEGGQSQYSEAKEIHIHPHFNFSDPLKDNVALIKIADGLAFNSFVRTLCLPGVNDGILMHKKTNRWLVSWNSSTPADMDPETVSTEKPWERTMRLHDKHYCNTAHPGTARLGYLQCMGDRHQKLGMCGGDLGAPVVVLSSDIDGKPIYKMVAMVTDGTQCMKFGKLTVVSEIESFMNWINSKMTD